MKVYDEFTLDLAEELGRPSEEVDAALALFAEIDVDAHRAAVLLRGAAIARYNLRRFAQSLVAARQQAECRRRLPLPSGHRLERLAWRLIDGGRAAAPAGRLLLRLLR